MRLTVLGGSAASPNSGAGCSGYLVETPGARIVLDLGPGTLHELRRHADMRSVTAIVVSHMHVDHVLDLLALRHALAYNPVPAAAPVPVWLPPGGAAFLARAVAPFDECEAPGRFAATVRVAEFDPALPLPIGDAVVTFAPAVHDLPAWATRVSGPGGGDLAYTGDTGPAADLAGFFAGAAVVVAEATLLESGRPPLRRTRLADGRRGRGAGARRRRRNTGADAPLAGVRVGAAAGAGRAAFGGRIEVARPGLVIEW